MTLSRFQSWSRTRRIVVVSALGLLAIGALMVAVKRHHDPATPDPAQAAKKPMEFQPGQLVSPQRLPLSVDLDLPGTVAALEQATVRSRLSASLRAVSVREGDPVRQGQVLAEFDTTPLRALQAERQADLTQAQALLAQAQRTRESNAQLVRQSFITQNAYETADANYQAQVAAVESARAKLNQIQLQLDDAVVRAPITGRIARRLVQSGEKVAQDAQLFVVVDLQRLEVQAQADVADAARIAVGIPADIHVEGLDAPIHAQVDRINPSADPASRVIQIYLDFTNPAQQVRAGMFSHVRLHLSAGSSVLSLPTAAVREDGGQSVVWEVRDNHLVRHLVTLGRRDDHQQRVEILGGVDDKAQILSSRVDGLTDGAEAHVLAVAPASH
jgi:RND family efflux transporter MFP subunit